MWGRGMCVWVTGCCHETGIKCTVVYECAQVKLG